jgi:transcriptional regulator with XRE-family HTH domain
VARTIDEILTPETGLILRQAREARKLSVDDVAARLRLHPHYIASMEAGDLTPLPPGPYRKAFLTEYAKFLNIKLDSLHSSSHGEKDSIISSAVSAVPEVARKVTKTAVKTTESAFKKVEEGVKDAVEEITARNLWEEADDVRKERLGIVDRVDEEPKITTRRRNVPPPEIVTPPSPQAEVIPEPQESRRSRRTPVQVPAIHDTYVDEYEPEAAKDDDDGRPGMSRSTKTIVGLLIVIAAIVGYSIFTKKPVPTPVVQEPEQKTAVKQPEQKPKPPVKKDTVVTPPTPITGDSLIFTITANDSVWVSVSPDVGKNFRGKLAKGEVRRFSAKDKYFLFIGNLKAVSMTLDGKPVTNLPTIPGSKMVVRNVVLERGKISLAPEDSHKEPAPKKKNSSTPKKKSPKQSQGLPQIPPSKPMLPH